MSSDQVELCLEKPEPKKDDNATLRRAGSHAPPSKTPEDESPQMQRLRDLVNNTHAQLGVMGGRISRHQNQLHAQLARIDQTLADRVAGFSAEVAKVELENARRRKAIEEAMRITPTHTTATATETTAAAENAAISTRSEAALLRRLGREVAQNKASSPSAPSAEISPNRQWKPAAAAPAHETPHRPDGTPPTPDAKPTVK